jgi:hypothetical protein
MTVSDQQWDDFKAAAGKTQLSDFHQRLVACLRALDRSIDQNSKDILALAQEVRGQAAHFQKAVEALQKDVSEIKDKVVGRPGPVVIPNPGGDLATAIAKHAAEANGQMKLIVRLAALAPGTTFEKDAQALEKSIKSELKVLEDLAERAGDIPPDEVPAKLREINGVREKNRKEFERLRNLRNQSPS